MGLAPEEQQVLTRIENQLRCEDPKLALRLEVFGQQQRGGTGPACEHLSPRRPRRRWLSPLLAAALIAALSALSVMLISNIGHPVQVRVCARAAPWLPGCQAPASSGSSHPVVPRRLPASRGGPSGPVRLAGVRRAGSCCWRCRTASRD